MRLTIAADIFSHTRDSHADNGYPMTTENAWQLAAQCLYTVINSNPDTVQAPGLLIRVRPRKFACIWKHWCSSPCAPNGTTGLTLHTFMVARCMAMQ
jgi:hypothetical protein